MGERKDRAPGKGPSNEQFLAEMFGETNNNILICGFKGHPKDAPQTAWNASPWRKGSTWNVQANNYGVVSTFTGNSRRKRDFAALHVVMVDDVITRSDHVGGKVPKSAVTLPPTWALETSPGNCQVGYKLAEPITDLTTATRLIAGICHAVAPDEKDPGMLGVTRYFKLPQGVNGKHGHVNRMTAWHPSRTYTLEELCTAFKIDYAALVKPVEPILFDTDKYPEGGPVVKALDWYAEQGNLKFEDEHKFEITCPWVAEHSEDRDDGTAIGKPKSSPDVPGFWFKCHHGGCSERRLSDFMLWCREHGWEGDRTSAAEDFAAFQGEGEVPAAPMGFKLFTYDTLDLAEPPPRQLVEDVLVYGEMTLISAQPNTGKSAFALDLAEHIAAGVEWHGKEVEQGGALYVCAESPATIKSRMMAAKARRGGHLPLYGTIDAINLVSVEDRNKFTAKMKATLDQLPGISVIIVDTFRSASPGVQENDAESISPIITYLHRMAHDLGVHVILVHHTTKAGGTYSGSGVFGAIVDTEIIIWDETDLEGETAGHANRGCLVAHILQQRGLASKHQEFMYRIEGVETGRVNNFGRNETAPLVVHLNDDVMASEQAARDMAEQIAREQARVEDMDRFVVAARQYNTLSPRHLSGLIDMPERRLVAARDALVADGAIVRGNGNNYRWA